jgi:hypothetical protein
MTTTITNLDDLRYEIARLELKQELEQAVLKDKLVETYEYFKPGNLIRNSMEEMISSPNLRSGVINTAMGIFAGIMAKKVVAGSTHNPIKQLLGVAMQFGISNLVSKNGDGLRMVVSQIARAFAKSKKD